MAAHPDAADLSVREVELTLVDDERDRESVVHHHDLAVDRRERDALRPRQLLELVGGRSGF